MTLNVSGAGWKDRARVVPLALKPGSPVLPFEGHHQRASEQYRIARTKILQDPRDPQLLAITSPQVGDGKSVTAVNLAGALALKDEFSVLLVDADFRRSSLVALLNLPEMPGLSDVLAGECKLEDVVVRVDWMASNLYFLPAGKKRRNPTELLDSTRWAAECTNIRNEFRFAVIDTPPIGVVADYDLVQAAADGVVLVFRPDHTQRARCLEAVRAIPSDKLIGAIANCIPDCFVSRSHYQDYEYSSRHE